MLDLGYGSLILVLILPPTPLPAGLGTQKCEGQSVAWSPGPSIFRSFFRFDFELNFGLVLGPFWGRLGLLLVAFWEPKSGQVGPKCVLKRNFFENADFHETVVKPMPNGQKCPQDGPKIASRPVQDGSKSDKKVMHFSS